MIGERVDGELLTLVDEPMFALDREGRFRYVNPAALRLKGLHENDLFGQCLWEIFPQARGSLVHEYFTRAEATPAPIQFESFDASLHAWFDVHLYPSEDGLWVTFRDITSRKASELALQDSERRFRQLFENVPVALYRTSTDGKLLDVNPALVKMLKYPDVGAFMSVNAADVYVDPVDRQTWQAMLARNTGVAVFEMRDRCFDGSIIWVRDTATAVLDANGGIMYYQGTLEDITERKEAEEALRESEARFRLLATASDDVIWDWDIVSGAVHWNAALKTVFGFSPEDIGPGIEHSYAWWIAHIHEDDRARVAHELHTAVHGDAHEWVGEYQFRRLDGSYARVLDRGYIGRDEQGAATRIIGSIIDLDRQCSRTRTRIPAAEPPSAPPVPITSDATLVTWVARGNEKAFEQLYARHASFIFAVAQPLLRDSRETDEVVADVFLQIWKSAAQYDLTRGTVFAWVASIARARSLERLRKAGRRQRLFEGHPPAPMIVREEEPTPIDRATEALLQRSLMQLPEPQRRVIELAYFSGLSHAEIARRLDEPLGTVKTRMRAGLEKLRRGLSAV